MQKLSLTIPHANAQTDQSVEIRPSAAQRWLSSLPFADPNYCAQQLLAALSSLIRQPLDARTLTQLLDLHRQAFHTLHNAYIGQLELSIAVNPQLVETLNKITIELGFGYKTAIMEQIKNNKLWGKKKALALPFQRAIHYLSLSLINAYQNYSSRPKNVWREILQIYLYAEAQDFHHIRVDDEQSAGEAKSSVVEEFGRIALLEYIDPSRFSPAQTWEIGHFLQCWSAEILIQDSAIDEHTPGFIVSLDYQKSSRMSVIGATAQEADTRFIDTTDIGFRLEECIGQLTTSNNIAAIGFSDTLGEQQAQQLLQKMRAAWTQPPQRKNDRQQTSGQIQLAWGIYASYYFLNKERAFNTDEFSDILPDTDIDLGNEQHPEWVSRTATNYSLEAWHLVNQSPGGMALRTSSSLVANIKVGHIMLLRRSNQANRKNWILAAVRWINRTIADEIQIGIQYLGKNAQPAALQLRQDNFQPALVLELGEARDQTLVLLTNQGVYSEDKHYTLRVAGKTQEIVADKLADATDHFERFTYRLLR